VPACADWAECGRKNLRATQADVAQQMVIEPRQFPRPGTPAGAAPQRIDHRFIHEANRAAKASGQRVVAAHVL
jgi:hypothetical protein